MNLKNNKMILLKELKLNNYISHENTSISFSENQKLLLDGASGSGKSSITEGILWCLYGTGRSESRSLVRRGSKNATVSIKFAEEERETVITRSTSDKGKNTLAVTQNTGSEGQFLPIDRTGIKDIQEWIEKDFIRASYQLFTNSIAYPQDQENSFVKANASKRKDLLLEIVRAGSFEGMYEKVRAALSGNAITAEVNSVKLERLNGVIKKAEELSASLPIYEEVVDSATKSIEASTTAEKILETQISSISQLSKQISDKKTIQQMLEKSTSTIQEEIVSRENAIKEHESFDISIHQKNILEVEKLNKEVEDIELVLKNNQIAQQKVNSHLSNRPSLFDYTAEIETINTRLIGLLKENETCPAGEKCPFLLHVRGQIEFLTSQIEEKNVRSTYEQEEFARWEQAGTILPQVKDTTDLYNRLKEIKAKIEILSKSKDVITRYETVKDSIGELRVKVLSLKFEKDEIQAEILIKTSEIMDLDRSISEFDINKINIELSTLRMAKQKAEANRQEALTNIGVVGKVQLEAKEASTGLLELHSASQKVYEDKESLELLKEAFSPRGIKAVVVDYIVPQLEDRINGVLSQMSDFRIRLDTQKATADEEGVKEGLFITVLNDRQEELPYEAYSGGERVKITTSISEALASLVSGVGFRILDENIVSLDKESTEGFVAVLEKLQDNFPQMLLISHLQEVKDLFEHRITIVKTHGISKII